MTTRRAIVNYETNRFPTRESESRSLRLTVYVGYKIVTEPRWKLPQPWASSYP
jgi:hypothetical protein